MKKIKPLRNSVQTYAWGSKTAIPELLDQKTPATKPQAELWMGAHPKAPSFVACGDKWESLIDSIQREPEDILGRSVIENFGRRLPYLFKILAASRPLSIQVHPNLVQAKAGFQKENDLGLALDAPNRNYRDDNHKPECIYAITPFWALYGFRPIADIRVYLSKVCPHALAVERDDLRQQPNAEGMAHFIKTLMTMPVSRKKTLIDEARKNARNLFEKDKVFEWVAKLCQAYPEDIGSLAPVFMNLLRLEPGQAMFLQSGELHAYLQGVGVELMANSDNVLRGGLTPKHIDVPELLNVLNFNESKIKIFSGTRISSCERIYRCPAREFVLAVINTEEGLSYQSANDRSVEIILCTEGKATITDNRTSEEISLNKGTSLIIPAAVAQYRIDGKAKVFKAAVPV